MKNVLFVAPKIANLYKDIIAELERQGYGVDYYEYKSYKYDPYNCLGYRKYGKLFVSRRLTEYKTKKVWTDMLNSENYNKAYDILFVIDGDSLHPCLFDILKSRNRNVKTVNYLFDTTKGVYEFNRQFQYFDKVATFDIEDSLKYKVDLLPIYWVKDNRSFPNRYKFFGMGGYIKSRYDLFHKINDFSKKHNLESFIKIVTPDVRKKIKYKIKYSILKILGNTKKIVPPELLDSEISTHTFMSTLDYRQGILESDIIIDTNAPHQDGLTARFMWALGAGKKILTTNAAVKKYSFYTPNQIYVLQNIEDLENNSKLDAFISSKYVEPVEVRSIIDNYRLDNWLNYLLS